MCISLLVRPDYLRLPLAAHLLAKVHGHGGVTHIGTRLDKRRRCAALLVGRIKFEMLSIGGVVGCQPLGGHAWSRIAVQSQQTPISEASARPIAVRCKRDLCRSCSRVSRIFPSVISCLLKRAQMKIRPHEADIVNDAVIARITQVTVG